MEKYPLLNLPPADLRIRKDLSISGSEVIKVFDQLRNKWLVLTPEEWVRQNFVNWLHTEFGYPLSLMANEVAIEVNGTRKRCDTVIFTPQREPSVIVEYKEPRVKITQEVFDQIVRYNMELRAHYLIVSNGLQHFCCRIDYDHNSYYFVPELPKYNA